MEPEAEEEAKPAVRTWSRCVWKQYAMERGAGGTVGGGGERM